MSQKIEFNHFCSTVFRHVIRPNSDTLLDQSSYPRYVPIVADSARFFLVPISWPKYVYLWHFEGFSWAISRIQACPVGSKSAKTALRILGRFSRFWSSPRNFNLCKIWIFRFTTQQKHEKYSISENIE